MNCNQDYGNKTLTSVQIFVPWKFFTWSWFVKGTGEIKNFFSLGM